jgi:uncharacterized protein
MKLTRRRFIAGTLASLPGWGAANALLVEPNWIRLETVEVPIRGLGRRFDGYRIALLADIHYPRRMPADFVRRAVRIGNRFKPDLWTVAGDVLDHKGLHQWEAAVRGRMDVPSLAGLFDEMAAPDGNLVVRGNHDHWLNGPEVSIELMRSTPLEMVENRCIVIDRGGEKLAVGGVGDMWEGEVDPRAAFRDVPPDVPRVLLSHNPDLAEEMKPLVRVDLQLSGHTHGGEVRVPFGPAPVVPSRYGQKFRAGLVEGEKHRVYITRGICTPRRVRFWCPPEVTRIVLRCV